MKSIPFKLVGAVLAVTFVIWGAWIAFKWTVMRVYVPPDMALMVTSKFGEPLPPDRITVPPDGVGTYKGVHEELLGPGRYFLDPISYDYEPVPQVKISAGEPDKWQWDPQGRLRNP